MPMLGNEPDYITLTVDEVIHETEKALLFRVEDKKVWCPKSIIDQGSNGLPDVGDEEVEVRVADWWAKKEGWV